MSERYNPYKTKDFQPKQTLRQELMLGVIKILNKDSNLLGTENLIDGNYDEAGQSAFSNKKYNEAFYFFSLSALHGDPNGFRHLAYMFVNGDGIKQNSDKGLELLTRAAILGDQKSISAIKQIYNAGGMKNLTFNKLNELHKLASENNCGQAIEILKILEQIEKSEKFKRIKRQAKINKENMLKELKESFEELKNNLKPIHTQTI